MNMKYDKVVKVTHRFWLIVCGQNLGFHSFNKYFQLELELACDRSFLLDSLFINEY